MTHRVYYLYDADGWLLYVGCSANVDKRVACHRRTQHWRRHIDIVMTSRPLSERDALALESAEIRRLAPIFNVRDNVLGRLLDEEWWDGLYAERQDGMSYPSLLGHMEEYAARHPRPVHDPRFVDADWFRDEAAPTERQTA